MKPTTLSPPTPPPGKRSWWYRDELQTGEPCPPLRGEHRCDVAVVGGGFTGLWTAIALKERDPQRAVTILEASRCGSGASAMNGGKVSGYWPALRSLASALGDDDALRIARAGTYAQDALRRWCTSPGRDVWWREAGNLRVSTSPAQDQRIQTMVDEARRLGVPDTAIPLTVEQVQARCASPAMRGGVFLPEGANVHPGRLVRSLRKAALELGVAVHEDSPVLSLHKSAPSELSTREARVVAQDVVMASNVSLAADPALQPHLCVFSSYALMTEPAPQALARQGWHGDEGFSDFRMFLHYFRKTPDGRVLMGSGSGPIAMTGNSNDPRLSSDGESLDRTISGLRRLLPALAEVGVSASWGGALDVSTDRLPFFGTFPGSRVHYGCGYSGHGLNATWIGGQCLASLVLGQRDEWTASPFCTRALSRFPPEPWRTFGGRAIRWGILRCEEAAEEGMQGPWMARTLASAPEKLGMKIGTR